MMKKKQRIILPILLLSVLIFCVACGDDDTDSAQNGNDPTAETIKIKQGYDKLQSLFLQIDDTYTEEKLEKIVEDNDLHMETDSNVVMETMWISESETTGMGEGAETWYKFDTDSIRLSLFEDDENEDDYNYYVFSKTYQVRDSFISVDYTFDGKELYTENRLSGYIGKGKEKYEKITKWKSVRKALDYALSYK